LTACRQLIKKVLVAENFQKIQELEPTFKKEVLLRVYSLFSQTLK
jgi:acyl-CoA-binding protein